MIPARPLMARLGDMVDFNAPNGCWEWTGAVSHSGYGRISRGGPKSHVPVHRAMFENVVGPIPEGLQIDHLCRNTRCVNPEHLEPVTPRENTMRSEGRAYQNTLVTVCPVGHEYTAETTYVAPNGGRSCRPCRTAAQRAYMARKRKAVQA